MIGTPTLRLNLSFGTPEHLMSFKNSVVNQYDCVSHQNLLTEQLSLNSSIHFVVLESWKEQIH